MSSFREHIDINRLPRHIAIIMDGNGRWARKKGAMRIFGHRNAVQSVREVTEACAELGISYLTLYAFSTENWGRPKEEVDGLMELLVHTLRQEINTLLENQIKLITIGDIAQLPPQCQENIQWAIDKTKHNKGVTLILALSYSGRWEMTQAVKAIARDVKSGKINPAYITEETIERYLATAGIPDPELLKPVR